MILRTSKHAVITSNKLLAIEWVIIRNMSSVRVLPPRNINYLPARRLYTAIHYGLETRQHIMRAIPASAVASQHSVGKDDCGTMEYRKPCARSSSKNFGFENILVRPNKITLSCVLSAFSEEMSGM